MLKNKSILAMRDLREINKIANDKTDSTKINSFSNEAEKFINELVQLQQQQQSGGKRRSSRKKSKKRSRH